MNYLKIYNNLIKKANNRKRLEFFCTHYILQYPSILSCKKKISIYNAPKIQLTKKEFILAEKLSNKLKQEYIISKIF